MTAVAAATSADELLRRCLAAYPGADQNDDLAEQDSIRRVAEHLNATDSEAAVCIICLELLKRQDAVWSCTGGCCDTVHLACIQAWARQQIREAATKAEATRTREHAAAWCCPKCRCEYPAAAVPSQYLCYCGKQVDPQPSLWLPAHSCGDTCGRQLPCGHSHECMLLCHPGPCPACPRMVSASCYCGKVETQRRCHQSVFACGKLCGQQLACGHRCPHRCHEGQCPPCGLAKQRTCACGAETTVVPCSVADFHCGPCNQLHDCGQHACSRDCHADPCGTCPLSGPRACGCGKTTVEGLSCQDPTPTCGATCDRVLPCGLHRCIERCHVGPCSDVCRTTTEKSCACGSVHKEVPCCESLRCQRKCAELRNCGRHACRRRCCDGDHPMCQEECGRLLKCGNHRCKAPCHAGKCLPCTRELHVACACGTTSYRLPCGWEARAKPPICAQVCRVPRICRHAKSLPTHRCHFGPCPPCTQPCSSVLQPCGHRCAAEQCHDPQSPDIPAFTQPPPPQQPLLACALDYTRPPAASAKAAEAAVKLHAEGQAACPPCEVLVKRWCQGAHNLIPQPCSDASLKSCSQPCGRRLPCGSHFANGIHLCSLPCHPLSTQDGHMAMPAGTTAEAGCETCNLPCGRQRVGCAHPCQQLCHPGNCNPCGVAVTQACHCGKTNLTHQCHELTEGGAARLLSCAKQCLQPLPSCPHLCRAQCHAGLCPGMACCKEEVAVRCGCRRLKERWQCHKVQAELQGHGLSSNGSYDGTAALRLLPCTAQCKSTKGAATEALQQQVSGTAQKPVDTVVQQQQEQQQRHLQQARRRQQAKGSAGAEDAGPTYTGVLASKLRKLQRRCKKYAVPVTIVCMGLLCAFMVYINL